MGVQVTPMYLRLSDIPDPNESSGQQPPQPRPVPAQPAPVASVGQAQTPPANGLPLWIKVVGGVCLAAAGLRLVRGAVLRRNGLVAGVVYSPGETGWVEDLGDGTWRVANVPSFSPLNIDDVVTLEEDEDGRQAVKRVISRAFPKKAGIRYSPPTESVYQRLVQAFERKGWKLEGSAPGFAVLAHDSSGSPCCVADDAGLEITAEKLPLRMRP